MLLVILNNFSFTMFCLGLLIAFSHWMSLGAKSRISGYEVFYRWIALLGLGVVGLYAFVMHAFFPEAAAATIGWQNSPFQYEVAVANLGFGLLGLLSFKASYGFRVATVVGNTCWLWGDAMGHIYRIITQHNFTVGNAGSWLWMDILIPLVLIICIVNLNNKGKKFR